MTKHNKKALGLAVNFASTKEDMLKVISKLTSSSVSKLSKLSTTQLAQILSVILHKKKHEQNLLFKKNNLYFMSEFLSQNAIRELNNKNIKRRKPDFPVHERVYEKIKLNAYLVANKALRISLTLASQNRIMDSVNMLSEPQIYNKNIVH